MNNYILPFLWMKGESEELIRTEIEKIAECGIGAVCLESRPHPDFMGEQWWKDLRFIISECKKREMKVWILDDVHFPTGYANGLVKDKYPERRKWYINYSTCDVWGSREEMDLKISSIMHPTKSWMDLAKPQHPEEEANNELISVTAYRLVEQHDVDESSVIDLTDQVKDGWLTVKLPEGSWRVYVVYKTRNGGENEDYLNPIDKEAASTLIEAIYEPHYEHLKDEFGGTIAGFFSDEPGYYNIGGFAMDERIGHKEMVLPWSDSAAERLEAACGPEYARYLPLLWAGSLQDEMSSLIRSKYMDVITQLYSECFCGQLGDWCAAHGVEYIGHVLEDNNVHARLGAGAGHYFRSTAGQHMAGIDVISQQITPGGAVLETGGVFRRDNEFNHYAMGKMGASAGHLDPKKQGRTMCELFGAYGWRLGTRDMKWILDHLLTKGINYLVPHAFSMAEYPDEDCPPHYYARGHYSQFEPFAQLMKYANRMCDWLNGGQHVAKTALLYHGEHEWAGEAMLMQTPAREMIENQIEFDIVSLDMLSAPEDFDGYHKENAVVINGMEFTCLVVPYAQKISSKLHILRQKSPKLPIIFVNDFPEAFGDVQASLDETWNLSEDLWTVSCRLGELARHLTELGAKDIVLSTEHRGMCYYRYQKDCDIYLFHNEDIYRDYVGEIALPLKNGAVIYDAMADTCYRPETRADGDMTCVKVEIPIYGICMILDKEPEEALAAAVYPTRRVQELQANGRSIDISSGWTYSLRKHVTYDVCEAEGTMDELVPVSRRYPKFSGHIIYEKTVMLDEKPMEAWLEIEHLVETAKVSVNGVDAGMLLCPPYRFDISESLRKGKNTIRIEAITTMARDQLNRPDPFIILDYEPLEASGMYGCVNIRYND